MGEIEGKEKMENKGNDKEEVEESDAFEHDTTCQIQRFPNFNNPFYRSFLRNLWQKLNLTERKIE